MEPTVVRLRCPGAMTVLPMRQLLPPRTAQQKLPQLLHLHLRSTQRHQALGYPSHGNMQAV
jgi:hypothetical protein